MALLKKTLADGAMVYDEDVFAHNLAAYDPWRNGLNDDSETFLEAFSDIGDYSAGHLYVPRGCYAIAKNLEFPEKLVVTFDPGARLYIEAGVTVTMKCRLRASAAINTGPGMLYLSEQFVCTMPTAGSQQSIDFSIANERVNNAVALYGIFRDGDSGNEIGRVRMGGTEDVNSLPSHAGLAADVTSNNAEKTKHVADADLYRASAVYSHRDDTAIRSTENRRTLLASERSRAAGYLSLVGASALSNALEDAVAILGCFQCDGMSDNAMIAASRLCTSQARFSTILSSYGVASAKNFSVTGGFAPLEGITPSARHALWEIDSLSGTVTAVSGFHAGPTASSVAVYLENAAAGALPVGALVTLDGDKVRLAADDETGDGVVVHPGSAGLVLRDAPYDWAGKYVTDDYGKLVHVNIPDPTWSSSVPDPAYQGPGNAPMIPNPAARTNVLAPRIVEGYNPTDTYTPRSLRTENWTLVGTTGILCVNVAASVIAGDYVVSGADGVGKKAGTGVTTRLKVMRKVSETVAQCWVR